MKIAKYMEFKYIRLLVTKEIHHKYLMKYKCRVIDEYLVLHKRLKETIPKKIVNITNEGTKVIKVEVIEDLIVLD